MGSFLVGKKAKVKFSLSQVRALEINCIVRREESDRISLTFPDDMQEFAHYLFEGQEIDLILYTDRGIRVLDSIVIDSPLEGDFVVEYYEDDNNIQRREYVRAQVKANLMIYQRGIVHPIKTTTIDIGGGGLRFNTPEEFIVGDEIDFALNLPGMDLPIKGSGEVLKMVKQDDGDWAVILFTKILESDRNKIIKYCFEIEAAKLKQMKM